MVTALVGIQQQQQQQNIIKSNFQQRLRGLCGQSDFWTKLRKKVMETIPTCVSRDCEYTCSKCTFWSLYRVY